MTVVLLILMLMVVAAVVLLGAALLVVQRRNARTLAEELRRVTAQQSDAAVSTLATMHRQGVESQLTLGAQQLEGKKELIDQELIEVRDEFQKLQRLVRELEQDRNEKFGMLSNQLREASQQTQTLTETTQSLREALSSTKTRGQWGERMAEDVLRLAGLLENVNYRKQRAVEGSRGIPDFTFFLPNDLLLHMDVKFPLDNYLRYLESDTDLDRKRSRDAFLRDVRARVRELVSRDYVDPESGTVEFMLLFIPNEQLCGFIHEQDGSIFEDAARQGVIFCSPLTLFAMLALIRQTVDTVQVARTSNEILGLLATFDKQWRMFVEKMDKLDRSLVTARKDFDDLVGTRRRALERPLEKIQALREQQPELSAIDDEKPEGGALALEA
jgi:DNA recombination protein RmuC